MGVKQQFKKQERHLEQNVFQVLASPWSVNMKTCIKFLSITFIEFSFKQLNSELVWKK
jgi:hypothetical protein